MVNNLEDIFPRLRGSAYRIESPQQPDYNCIAHAAGDQSKRWWPDLAEKDSWPEGVPREETLEAFRAAFMTLGFLACETPAPESGFEKVALFADAQGVPTHAARQVGGDRWTSKLGELEDIEHALHNLEGAAYGSVVLVLKRPLPTGRGAEAGALTA